MTTVTLNAITRKVEVFSSARDVQARAYGHDSKPALEAVNVPPGIDHVFLRGYAAAGDGGAAHYKRVASEPGHPGKIQSSDGAWWEVDETRLNVRMFGTGTAAFQAAIDTLSANGGQISVPPGDYSTITPASLTTGSKVVTWEADRGVTLPADMPGAVVSQGIKDWWASGAVQRTGDVFWHVDLGDRGGGNGRDRAFHVHGYLSDNISADDRTLAAYSFYLESNHDAVEGGNIRGLYGSVVGNGGQANVRAIRVVAEGITAHSGDLTGILATVDRPDEVDGEPGSIGVAVAVMAEVGAKCSAAFEARSFRAQQRPSFGMRIRQGSSALLPNVACYSAHGGGNGDLFQAYRDSVSSDTVFSVDNKARIMARSYYSGQTTIADDAVVAIAVNDPTGLGSTGFIKFWIIGNGSMFGEGYYRVNASPVMTEVYKGNSAVAFATGALIGTTGTDGNITISAHSDGKIYVENRNGASRLVAWAFTGASSQNGNLT